jgi:hypothetical protein
VCHPSRFEVIAPRFSLAPLLPPLDEPPFRLAFALSDCREPLLLPALLLLSECPANPFDAVPVRPAALKKCCELEGALRNEDGLAARPDAL